MTDNQMRKFHCLECKHEWEVPFGGGRQLVCPRCGSMNIHRTNPGPRPDRCWGSRRRMAKPERSN